MKDTFYFSHDYSTRSDEKIKRLIRKYGFLGYGIFWALVEELYMNANALQTDYEGIAYDLHTDKEIVKSIINDFDLFEINGMYFCSLSIQRRLEERNMKSTKARQSALYRWDKSNNNANALRTQSDSNAIKESKGKESKVNIINWRTDFNIYKDILFEHYTELLNDNKWIAKMERLNPNVNIQLTLEKCCVNYWATEAGWKKNKAKKTEPNFKMTLQNAVSNKINYVYKNRYE